MSYVGSGIQDRMQAYEVADKQHWQRMQTLSGVESKEIIEIPPGYKCMFCEVQPLSTSRATWRLPFGHFGEKDEANKELREKILKRDNYTCCDCALRLPRHMEVRHLDEDHSNNEPSNLKCVCPFCHMRDHLGPTGFAQAAYVVGSSRISQAQLNVIVLLCWYITDRVADPDDLRVTREAEEDAELALSKAADRLLNELYTFGIRWTESLSKAAIDPFTFGTILSRFRYEVMEDEEPKPGAAKGGQKLKEVLKKSSDQTDGYKNRSASFSTLALLPRREAFQRQCKDWFNYLDGLRPVSVWEKGFESFLSRNDLEDEKAIYEIISAWNKVVGAERNGTFTPILPPFNKAKAEEVKVADPSPPETLKNQAALNIGAAASVAAVSTTEEVVKNDSKAEKPTRTTQDAKKSNTLADALDANEKAHTERSEGSISEPKTPLLFDLTAAVEKAEADPVQPVEPDTPSLFGASSPESTEAEPPPVNAQTEAPETPSLFDFATEITAPSHAASDTSPVNGLEAEASEPQTPSLLNPLESSSAPQTQAAAVQEPPQSAWGASGWGDSGWSDTTQSSTPQDHSPPEPEPEDDFGGDFVEEGESSGGQGDDDLPSF
jgi:hypothetical protein